MTLPAYVRVVAVPDPVAVNTPFLGYEASCQLEGRRLTARLVAEDRVPAGICSVAVSREFKNAAKEVLKDVRQLLLFH